MSKQIRDIYSSLEKRNGLKNSEYHRAQLQEWLRGATKTFKEGNSEQKLDSLTALVETFCRSKDANEYMGSKFEPRFENVDAVKGLYSAQKAVLKIIARQIKQLDPVDQHALLKDFIETHLEHMGNSSDPAHNPQRKAIKMIGELLPALKMKPTHRAELTESLMRKLSAGKINMDHSVMGIFNRTTTQTSDVAAQVVSKELRSISRKNSELEASIREELKETFKQAMLDYDKHKNGPTRLHSNAWKKAFNNVKLDPHKWTEKQPKGLLKKEKPTFDRLQINALEAENARLLKELQGLRRRQGPANVHSKTGSKYTDQHTKPLNRARRRSTIPAPAAAGEYGLTKLEGYSNRPLTEGISGSITPHLRSGNGAASHGDSANAMSNIDTAPLPLSRPEKTSSKSTVSLVGPSHDYSPLSSTASTVLQDNLAKRRYMTYEDDEAEAVTISRVNSQQSIQTPIPGPNMGRNTDGSYERKRRSAPLQPKTTLSDGHRGAGNPPRVPPPVPPRRGATGYRPEGAPSTSQQTGVQGQQAEDGQLSEASAQTGEY
jgi:hypothetical protein